MLEESFIHKDFYLKDVFNNTILNARIIAETDRIFKDSKLNNGRNKDKINFHVRQGLALEHLIANNHSNLFVSADNIHDLCHNITGDFYEVKAYTTEDEDNPYILRNLEYIKNSNSNKSKYMIVYTFYPFEEKYSYLACIKIR